MVNFENMRVWLGVNSTANNLYIYLIIWLDKGYCKIENNYT